MFSHWVGEGIARGLAAEGAAVAIHGLEEDLGRAVASELPQATFIPGDLFDPKVPAELVARTVDAFGRLDGVVNNAGTSERANLETTTPEIFDRILGVNARAPFLVVQAAVPHLRAAGGGSIVNIGSVHAHGGSVGLMPYAMSKAALTSLTRSLSNGLAADRIRVNQVNPGWVLTPNERALVSRSHGWDIDWPEKMEPSRFPLGRIMVPADLVPLILCLLSPETSMLTGQDIDFDQKSQMGTR